MAAAMEPFTLTLTKAAPMPKRTDAAMTEALAKLQALGFEPEDPTDYQLKIGIANYYPVKGTVFVDGEVCRRDGTGFEAFVAVLRETCCLSNDHGCNILPKICQIDRIDTSWPSDRILRGADRT
jgi:hypothetical protein